MSTHNQGSEPVIHKGHSDTPATPTPHLTPSARLERALRIQAQSDQQRLVTPLEASQLVTQAARELLDSLRAV